MRNVVVALLLATGPAALQAQTTEWANKLVKDSTTHDFGTVFRGAKLLHRFELYNPYAVKLDLISTRASCGCVQTTASVQSLEPRASGFLDVVMDTTRFVGPKTVSIYVTVGPEYTSTATLVVSANIRGDVVFNPGEVNFGVVPRGQTPSKTIDIDYAGNLWNNWQVTDVVKNNLPVDVAIKLTKRQQGLVSYQLELSAKADAAPNSYRAQLQLRTNDPASPLVPVLVELTVQAPLQVVPGIVNLGSPHVGETLQRTILLRGSKPFTIMSIQGLGDGIEAELPTTPSAVQTVTLKYSPPKSGQVKKLLHIKTDLDSIPAATVTIEGKVVP